MGKGGGGLTNAAEALAGAAALSRGRQCNLVWRQYNFEKRRTDNVDRRDDLEDRRTDKPDRQPDERVRRTDYPDRRDGFEDRQALWVARLYVCFFLHRSHPKRQATPLPKGQALALSQAKT